RNHPVLEGISIDFSAKSWLYTLYPDYPSEGSTPLLMGKAVNPDNIDAIDHPVAWVGKNSFGTNFFMTTLGHPEDFEEEDFQKLIVNAVHWLLSKEKVNFAGKADIAVPYDTHPTSSMP
ncbi:MAG TPA: ThuA domain-containing protein, partial [Anditalea sp.]|nr:ThuA domain-containing protein [Anditalea sp.]